MKSTAIAFFVFFVCILLGFTLAQSDLLNPVTAGVNAEVQRTRMHTETEVARVSLQMEQQSRTAEAEANAYLTTTLAHALFLLSAVMAACIVAITSAGLYWILHRTSRPPQARPRAAHMAPPSAQRAPGRPAAANGSAKAARKEQILQPSEHLP